MKKNADGSTTQVKINGENATCTIKKPEGNTVNTWDNQCEFKNLPKYENGKEIEYTVEEEKIEGIITGEDGEKTYAIAVTGDIKSGFTVTNTHTPVEIKSIKAKKVWSDNTDSDGFRPTEITFNLMKKNADGSTTQVKINGENATCTIKKPEGNTVNTWDNQCEFKNLPKYENGKEIEYTVEEEKIEGIITGTDGPGTYSFEVIGNQSKGFTITNKHTPEVVEIQGYKIWKDVNDEDGLRPESIQIQLLRDNEKYGKPISVVDDKDGDDNWYYSFGKLPKYHDGGKKYEYTVKEILPGGLKDLYTSEVKPAKDEEGNVVEGAYNITNTHTPKKLEITAVKKWNHIYTTEDGIEVTNRYAQDIEDNAVIVANLITMVDGKITDIGIETTTCELHKDNQWTCEFTKLPEYYKGKPISYSVEEDAGSIPYEYTPNYDTSTKNDVNIVTITNNYTPQLTGISGTKIWDDASDQDGARPDHITVNLYADGVKLEDKTQTISQKEGEKDSWTFSFDNLPATKDGKRINYTLTEESVDGYETPIIDSKDYNEEEILDGAYYEIEITNIHVLERVSFHIEKIWSDGYNQDGIRPDSITVRLMKVNVDEDGNPILDEAGNEVLTQVREATLNEDNEWTCEFGVNDDILYKNENGKPIIYRIVEDLVDGYEPIITPKDNEDENSSMSYYDITNSHTPELIDIEITKTWNDADDILKIRPGSIFVDINANGNCLMTVELMAENNWTLTVSGLNKYLDGNEIEYTLYEYEVEGYTTRYKGFNIINDLIPPKGGDVEELPPQTGVEETNNSYGLFGLIALMILSLRKLFQ